MPTFYRARHRRRLHVKIRETLALRRATPPLPPRQAGERAQAVPDTAEYYDE